MLRSAYDWTLAQASKPYALWMLGLVAFVESSVFPIPPDILLIPLVLADKRRAILAALICTAASVVGGFLGYAIGALLFDSLGAPILQFYGYLDKFDVFKGWYNDWGAWIVFMAGLTPFPYKVVTIASGATHLNLGVFAVASLLSRGLRFCAVSLLLWYFGEPIRVFIDKHFGWLSILFFLLLVGGFVALKLL